MSATDDFTSPLVEEILCDVAGRFFGSRREVDGWLEVFDALVTALRNKAQQVGLHAGVLNRLLLHGKAARAFYRELGADAVAVLLAHDSEPGRHLAAAAWYLRGARRYAHLVIEAYAALCQSIAQYREGSGTAVAADSEAELCAATSYRLVCCLAEEINKRICIVNRDTNPADTLQFARSLVSEADGTSDVCVPFCDYSNSYMQKLAFQPIDLAALKLPEYPLLPPLDQSVRQKISAFCRILYRRERQRLAPLLSQV